MVPILQTEERESEKETCRLVNERDSQLWKNQQEEEKAREGTARTGKETVIAGDTAASLPIIDIDWQLRQMQAVSVDWTTLQPTPRQVPFGPISNGATEQSVHLCTDLQQPLEGRKWQSIGHKSGRG